MSVFLQCVIGLALSLAGWIAPRCVAGARRIFVAVIIDVLPSVFVALVLFLASGRPVFAGAIVLALGAGFAFADRTMRNVLREPVVFTALSALPQVFTHPHLYLPFAGTGFVIGGALAGALAAFGLLIAEPTVATPQPFVALGVTGIVVVLLWRVGREPWLGWSAAALWRLGPVAMLIVHGIIARAERPARRAGLATLPTNGAPTTARPIVLVQSFSSNASRFLMRVVRYQSYSTIF